MTDLEKRVRDAVEKVLDEKRMVEVEVTTDPTEEPDDCRYERKVAEDGGHKRAN